MIRPAVFLCRGKYDRVTIAGWVYDQDERPANAIHYRWARLDWRDQIVEWAKIFPISTILIRHRQRPWAEYTLEYWAKKEKRVASVAAILVDRENSGWK